MMIWVFRPFRYQYGHNFRCTVFTITESVNTRSPMRTLLSLWFIMSLNIAVFIFLERHARTRSNMIENIWMKLFRNMTTNEIGNTCSDQEQAF
jgi:hypothetical protein